MKADMMKIDKTRTEKNAEPRSLLYKMITGGATGISILSLIVGCLTLAFNSVETYLIPLFYVLTAALFILFFAIQRYYKPRLSLFIFAIVSLVSVITVSLLPEYLRGMNIHGIISRSLISGLLMVVVALAGTCFSIYYWMGAKPHSADIARYPLLLLPALLVLAGFILIIYYIVSSGIGQLSWSLISKPFLSQTRIVETWQNGWPSFTNQSVKQLGMLNSILGTLLLMGLTSLISLPIGISVAVFTRQYAGPGTAGVISFCTTALRSISGIILLVSAMSLLTLPTPGSPIYYLLHGYGYDINGVLQTGRSSFLFASALISLLVIPIIAQATQEGLDALPRETYEGSLSLGATKEHTLFHLQLPWSLPNIMTGLLLGCAEAAGSLTVIFLIAGFGQYGVSPLHETTSLAYLILSFRFGAALGGSVPGVSSYQFTAALVLLIMTLGLTTTALIIKKNLAKRYKGE